MAKKGKGRVRYQAIVKTLVVTLSLGLSGISHSKPLQIVSWNMNNLTHPSSESPSRASKDIKILASAGKKMKAHIIAMQEVGDARTALDVFGSDYKYYMSSKDERGLRVGFAVSDSLDVTKSYIYTPLADGGGRLGVDITVRSGRGQEIRLLNAHLAEGCEEERLPSRRTKECTSISEQTVALAKWVRYRKEEGVPFMIMGTLSRYIGEEQIDREPGLLSELNKSYEKFGDGLNKAVDGLKTLSGDKRPRCWDYRRPDFVDHFLVDPSMRKIVVKSSFREAGFGSKWSKEQVRKLSDHCPIKMMVRM